MTTPNPESSAQRSATRAPVGKPIKLQFDDSMDVVEGVCENISIGGMFLQVTKTRSPGSLVRFELQVDDNIAIRGLGEVVWSQPKNAAMGEEAGIGIKFRFLEQRDRQLIFKLVSQHIKERLANQQTPGAGGIPGPGVPLPPAAAAAGHQAPAMTTPPTFAAEAQLMAAAAVDELAAAAELDDEQPTLIGNRRDPGRPDTAPPAELLPPVTLEPAPEPVARPAPAAPPAPVVETQAPAVETPPVSARSDLFGSPAVALDSEPAPKAPPSVADSELDRSAGPLDDGAEAVGAGDTAAVAIEYDLMPASRRRPLLLIVVILLLALAAAGYWFRDLIFGEDPAATAFAPAVAPAAVEPGPELPASDPGGESATSEVPATAEPAVSDVAATADLPASEEAAPAAAAVAKAAFSKVVDIRWGTRSGGLRVVIEADGKIPESRFRHFRLDGESPREVVRLLGVSQGFAPSQLAVGGPVLRQIRTGLHDKPAGRELHVVLDLADRRARVSGIRILASGLEISVAGP